MSTRIVLERYAHCLATSIFVAPTSLCCNAKEDFLRHRHHSLNALWTCVSGALAFGILLRSLDVRSRSVTGWTGVRPLNLAWKIYCFLTLPLDRLTTEVSVSASYHPSPR